MFQRQLLSFLLFCLPTLIAFSQDANTTVKLPVMTSAQSYWVDSIYNSLDLDQRIGQLFMVATYSGGEKYNQPLIEQLINEQGIGGLIFMQGTPAAQAEQTNRYQRMSKVPILVAMDAEWGLGMRLTGVRDFPRQLMMGAMQDSTIIYRMGAAIASQCRRLGVHIDFAPVVDVNNNPNNPVINFRSFGENKYKVARYALQYMKGLQDNGVMACAKHFPGHGDTDVDSHKDLPEISKSVAQLDALELYPFQQLIQQGIQSMMIAHLQVPAIDDREHTPSSISDKTISGLLKQRMGFNGLIFTDALNMQGIAKYYEPGEIDLKAFHAGNDMLLFSQDVATGKAKIKAAIESGTIPETRLAESVKKILAAKYNAGLWKVDSIATDHITEDLNRYVSTIRQQVAEASITLLNDPSQVIDHIKRGNAGSVVYVGVGIDSENAFAKALRDNGMQKCFFAKPTNEKQVRALVKKLKGDEHLLLGVHGMTAYPGQNFGLEKFELQLIDELKAGRKTLTMIFGNPYAAKNFCGDDGLLVAYDDAEETQQAVARIITGQLKANGRLPVSVCDRYHSGDGIVPITTSLGEVIDSNRFAKQNREITSGKVVLKSMPESQGQELECCVSPTAIGINNRELDKVDEFIASCIDQGAFPGCRILAARDGKVFYDKPFGYLDNEKKNPVGVNTIYDIASITKVASTTLAIMRLYEQGKLALDDSLGKYLPITHGTDKAALKLGDILAHQAGLKAWIPFYKETLDSNGYPRKDIYQPKPGGDFIVKVTADIYMNKHWIDTMWQRILSSPLENTGHYVYSDLDFLFLQKVIERITGKSIAEYVPDEFYKPLGLEHSGYLPKRNLPNMEVAPSEVDDYFRHEILQGYVHDMGAAMFGGVAGHAGVFMSANDLAVIFQMLLNEGTYRGRRYFKPATVKLFTARNSTISRRGLGFDKPEPTAGRSNPCADNVSLSAFGHQGFTGTCVWADPEHKLVYVFLSNRTYPSAENKLITRLNVREHVQETIYNALGIASRYRK